MSDQDFFFDDEDEKPAKDEKSAKGDKPKKSAPAKKAAARPAAGGSFWQQTVTTAVAGLVALIFMLLGVIVGIVLPVGGATADVPAPVTGSDGVAAPALTQEQLNSGAMPEGHPPLDAMTDDMTGDEIGAEGAEVTTTP